MKMDEYSSIKDSHLAHYFSRPDVFTHLMKMGLITLDGHVVTETEWRQSELLSDRKSRHESTESLDEGGLVKRYHSHKPLLTGPGRLRGSPKRHSVAFTLNDEGKSKSRTRKKRRKFPEYPIKIPKESWCPLRWSGRRGIVGEPYLTALPPLSRSSTPFSSASTATRGCVFERLYPEPPDDVVSTSYRARKSRFPPAVLTLQFLGPNRPTELMLLQQPCETYTVPIFTSIVTTGEHIEVVSQRREGNRFSVVICEDGVAISRLSSCCEHRYTSGRRLGGPSGHLRVLHITDGSPCSKCIERVETAKLKDRYLSSKKAIGNKRRPPSRHPLLLKIEKEKEDKTNFKNYDSFSDKSDEDQNDSYSEPGSETDESSGNKTYYHSNGNGSGSDNLLSESDNPDSVSNHSNSSNSKNHEYSNSSRSSVSKSSSSSKTILKKSSAKSQIGSPCSSNETEKDIESEMSNSLSLNNDKSPKENHSNNSDDSYNEKDIESFSQSCVDSSSDLTDHSNSSAIENNNTK